MIPRFRVLIVGALSFAVVAPLQAEVTPIPVDAAADWQHEQSGLNFPLRITELERTEMKDYGTNRLDVFAVYGMRGRGTWASLYAFRAGLPDVAIWSDRLRFIITSTSMGIADPTLLVATPFAPPNGAEGSGLRIVTALSGGTVSATGATVMRVDDWLFVVRMSSTSLDKTALEQALVAFTQVIPLAAGRKASPQGYAITACEDQLPGRRARRIQPDMAVALLTSVMAQTAEERGESSDEVAPGDVPHFCRDASSTAGFGVYRSGSAREGYTIAIGDAGTAAFVQPDSAAALMGGRRGQYALSLRTVDNDLNYGAFDRMPPPEQVMQTLQSRNPVSGTNRPLPGQTDRTISIQPNR